MTETDKQLLLEIKNGIIDHNILQEKFSVDLKNDKAYIRQEINSAIKSGDPDNLDLTIQLILFSLDISRFTDLLNQLLINPNHISHQRIAKTLQDNPSPTTIPFVRKALETNFDYLEYACSDSDAIAKWFSWILYSIGTKAAIDLMKEYSNSPDKGIKHEMLYRLRKIHPDRL